MIEGELLIEHLGEIKTHALKKIWLQRHCPKRKEFKREIVVVQVGNGSDWRKRLLTHSFAMELFEGNRTWKVQVIDLGVGGGGGGGGRRGRNGGRHWWWEERRGTRIKSEKCGLLKPLLNNPSTTAKTLVYFPSMLIRTFLAPQTLTRPVLQTCQTGFTVYPNNSPIHFTEYIF